jgi:hypothetical protein
MKTLLYKKIGITFAAVLLCIASVYAQIPDQLKNLPFFKLRAAILPSLHNPHAPGRLNAMQSSSDAPCLNAQTTLGGSNYDQPGNMIQTKDGGFIVCGYTLSGNGDFHAKDTINGDGYVAKYNRSRQLEWTKTFGGSNGDGFNDIKQTYDGGYIAVGLASSNDGDVSGNHGGFDVWLVKLSASGNIEWQKCYGGSGDEGFGDAVVQTFYGGYAVVSFTNSNDGDVSGNHNTDGNFDGWFIQVAPNGKLLYQHCYGGSDFDGFFGMVSSYGGSFILEGESFSNDGDISGNHGDGDAWVVKINALGKIVWQKVVGGSANENLGDNGIATTADGNVVIDGWSSSVDGDINAQNDTIVSFETKLNSVTGNIIWSKSYANPSLRAGYGMFATKDGGTVECGAVGPSFDNTTFDVLISRFDKNGNEEWYKRLGGSNSDGAFTGYESPNGDLNILCQTASTDGDVKNNHGNNDDWIIKLGRCGDYVANEVSSDDAMAATKNNTTVLSVYPNPVSNSATISFSLPQSQKISLQIFDMNGRLIETLVDEQMQQGNHQLMWDANNKKVITGNYLLKLQAGNYAATKTVAVVK